MVSCAYVICRFAVYSLVMGIQNKILHRAPVKLETALVASMSTEQDATVMMRGAACCYWDKM